MANCTPTDCRVNFLISGFLHLFGFKAGLQFKKIELSLNNVLRKWKKAVKS